MPRRVKYLRQEIIKILFLPLILFVPAVLFPNICIAAGAGNQIQDAKNAASQISSDFLGKYGSKQGINQRISQPMTSNATLMKTLNDTKSFTGQLICPSSKDFLEVFITPASSGDILNTMVKIDTDLDGTMDYAYTLPVVISGICANGIISCDPGTWNNCKNYEWIADQATGTVSIQQTGLNKLGGCYCINNSCGSSLVFNNIATVLKDLGGGIVSAMQSVNPKTAVTESKIDGTAIYYYGQKPGDCSNQTGVTGVTNAEQYYNNWAALTNDTNNEVNSQSSNSDSIYNLLVNSPIAQNAQLDMKSCNMVRNITPTTLGVDDIITFDGSSGNFNQVQVSKGCGQGCLEVILGISRADGGNNYFADGSCTVYNTIANFFVYHPELVDRVVIDYVEYDDYLQILVNNQVVATPRGSFPTGSCEGGTSLTATLNLDITQYFKQYGQVSLESKLAEEGGGEMYVRVYIWVTPECSYDEAVTNSCTSLESDPDCQLKEETVDGVKTYERYNPTGFVPLTSCQHYEATDGSCGFDVCRDWWTKSRTYACKSNVTYDFTKVQKRMESIGNSTSGGVNSTGGSISYTDLRLDKNGNWINESHTGPIVGMDAGSGCEMACKTKKVSTTVDEKNDTSVGLTTQRSGQLTQSTIGSMGQYYYKKCVNGVCPVGSDEQIVKDCQCLNEFAEAATLMQMLRLAGQDTICSSGTPQPLQ